jgi:5-aminopentanamidase
MVGFDLVPLLLVPARAYENQLFVAYANCCGREADIAYGGLSVLAGPDGRLAAQADDSPTVLTMDLVPDPSARSSHLADRRPDTYSALTAPAR